VGCSPQTQLDLLHLKSTELSPQLLVDLNCLEAYHANFGIRTITGLPKQKLSCPATYPSPLGTQAHLLQGSLPLQTTLSTLVNTNYNPPPRAPRATLGPEVSEPGGLT
jgi:hypothetical protein